MTNKKNLVTLKRDGYIEQGHTGEAYAFFDSPTALTPEDLRPESSDLVLRFAEGEGNFLNRINAGRDLREAVRTVRANISHSGKDTRSHKDRLNESEAARNREFGYGLHVRYGQSNEEAASALVDVMNYVNGRFVPGNEPFRAAILYEDASGRYVSRE